jgi:hypothetical protein
VKTELDTGIRSGFVLRYHAWPRLVCLVTSSLNGRSSLMKQKWCLREPRKLSSTWQRRRDHTEFDDMEEFRADAGSLRPTSSTIAYRRMSF